MMVLYDARAQARGQQDGHPPPPLSLSELLRRRKPGSAWLQAQLPSPSWQHCRERRGPHREANGWRRRVPIHPQEKFATDRISPYRMMREFSEDSGPDAGGRGEGRRQDPLAAESHRGPKG